MNPLQFSLEYPRESDYQLSSFVVCCENELAFKASKSAAEQISPDYLNPLIIVGGAGSGKTHLLYGIANSSKKENHQLKTLAVSLAMLSKRFRAAQSYREITAISDEFKMAELLLIDDVHLCEGDYELQEQVFHIFNEVIRKRNRIVLTSLHSPDELNNMESFLKSRLLTGASVKIGSSDDALRVEILKKIALDSFLKLSDISAKHITTHLTRDIRQFPSILDKISDYAFRTKKRVTPSLVKTIFENS